MDLQLNEKTALVTGAHRGTGQIIAKQLAAEGAQVWVHGFTTEQAESAAAEIPNARAVAGCLLYTSPSPRDATLSRMPSSA